MASLRYGYVSGPRRIVTVKVDASTPAAIAVGDLIFINSSGYAQQAAAGENVSGVAASAASIPGTDGYTSVEVDFSTESVYRYPPDAGSVTQALVGATCDVGGAQSLNIDASDDDCIVILSVDTSENVALCSIKPAYRGVA